MATNTRRRDVDAPSRIGRLPVIGALSRIGDRDGAFQRFVRDTRSELRKVTWPTREQTMNLTVIVCIVSGIVGILLGGIDLLFAQLFRLLLGRV